MPNRTPQAWEFTAVVLATGEQSGTLTVHRGSGHWANRINIETGKIGDMVWVYEATWTSADGTVTRDMPITRDSLLRLRREVKRQAAESEAR